MSKDWGFYYTTTMNLGKIRHDELDARAGTLQGPVHAGDNQNITEHASRSWRQMIETAAQDAGMEGARRGRHARPVVQRCGGSGTRRASQHLDE